jgi:small subunit ribosomal protein S2
VVDPEREDTAVREANILNIPVLALADTNCNPDVIDYILPGNDDAMRAIRLIVGALADAVLEGKMLRGKASEEVDADFEEFSAYEDQEEYEDEELLGKSTLAKLRDSNLFEDAEDDDEDSEVDDIEDNDESVEEEEE